MNLNRKAIYGWLFLTGLIAVLGGVLVMHPEYLAGASDFSEAAVAKERQTVALGFTIMKIGGALCLGSAMILKVLMKRFGLEIPD